MAAKLSKKVAEAMGASAALIMAITLLIMPWEGRVYIAYKDIGGVWTVCDGHTGADIIIGKVYTDPECDALTIKDSQIAEAAIEKLITYPVQIETKAAIISFVYNVGVGSFRTSTLLKKINAGDIKGGCKQLSRWVYVNDNIIQGLKNRRFLGDKTRISEQELCLMGVAA